MHLRYMGLRFGSNHTKPNRFPLTLRVFQTCLLRKFLRFEWLRERRKLTVDVLEKQPLLDDFGHFEFIARHGCAGPIYRKRGMIKCAVAEISLTGRYVDTFVKGLRRSVKERIAAALLSAFTIIYQITHHKWTPEIIKENVWGTLTPWVWILCCFVVWHVFKAAILLDSEVRQGMHETNQSLIFLPDGVRARVPSKYRLRLFTISGTFLLLFSVLSFLAWHAAQPPKIKAIVEIQEPKPSETNDSVTRDQTPAAQPADKNPEPKAKASKSKGAASKPKAAQAPNNKDANAQNNLNVGNLTQGPGSIAQIGGVGNQATIIGEIPVPARRLSDEQINQLTLNCSRHPSKVLILYTMNDAEAYNFAKQIGQALTAAGWTLKAPISGATLVSQSGPLSGLLLNWRGDRVPDGRSVPLDPDTPWGVLGIELNRDFPGSLLVQPVPDAEGDLVVLQVLVNPKRPS
jgi:hypothetical protein